MSNKSRNSASQRTHEWRELQKQQGNKQLSCWLNSSTIKELDIYCKQQNYTRNEVIVSAIISLLDIQSETNTEYVAETEPIHTPNAAETDSSISVMQQLQPIIDSLTKQLEVKDHQINLLLENQKANSYTIASSFKQLGLLEKPKEEHFEHQQHQENNLEEDNYYTPPTKTKKSKKDKKKKKKDKW
jgi:hypothetical protein